MIDPVKTIARAQARLARVSALRWILTVWPPALVALVLRLELLRIGRVTWERWGYLLAAGAQWWLGLALIAAGLTALAAGVVLAAVAYRRDGSFVGAAQQVDDRLEAHQEILTLAELADPARQPPLAPEKRGSLYPVLWQRVADRLETFDPRRTFSLRPIPALVRASVAILALLAAVSIAVSAVLLVREHEAYSAQARRLRVLAREIARSDTSPQTQQLADRIQQAADTLDNPKLAPETKLDQLALLEQTLPPSNPEHPREKGNPSQQSNNQKSPQPPPSRQKPPPEPPTNGVGKHNPPPSKSRGDATAPEGQGGGKGQGQGESAKGQGSNGQGSTEGGKGQSTQAQGKGAGSGNGAGEGQSAESGKGPGQGAGQAKSAGKNSGPVGQSGQQPNNNPAKSNDHIAQVKEEVAKTQAQLQAEVEKQGAEKKMASLEGKNPSGQNQPGGGPGDNPDKPGTGDKPNPNAEGNNPNAPGQTANDQGQTAKGPGQRPNGPGQRPAGGGQQVASGGQSKPSPGEVHGSVKGDTHLGQFPVARPFQRFYAEGEHGDTVELKNARYVVFRIPPAAIQGTNGKTVIDKEAPKVTTPFENLPMPQQRARENPDEQQLIPPRYRDFLR